MWPVWRRLGGLIVVAALVVAVGCGSTSKPARGPTTTPATTPSTTVTSSTGPLTTTTTTQPAVQTADVRVYYLHGDTLGVVHRTITATPRVAAAAMTELLAGPTPADSAASTERRRSSSPSPGVP